MTSHKYKVKRRKEGRCVNCGKRPPKKTCIECVQCLRTKQLTIYDMREQRREKGLCPQCGKRKPDTKIKANGDKVHLSRCKICLKQNRDNRRRKRNKIEIVFLVGSSRFKQQFMDLAYELETTSHLVLMMTFFQHSDGRSVNDEQRQIMRRVDRQKVELANRIIVLNCPRRWCKDCKCWTDNKHNHVLHETEIHYYIGEDTKLEIEYAEELGKMIQYLYEEKENDK